MFHALLGDSFEALPPAVRALHACASGRTFTGRCDIRRGKSLGSRAVGALMRLPRDGRDVPIHVTIVRTSRGETWTRDFAGRRMHSVLRARAGLLEERLGAATFRFAMRVEAGVLRWHLVAVRVLGIPLPLAWFDGVRATEEETAQGRYRFDVRAALPLVGLLVHYRGQLDAA